jgi:hypothetical protein
MLGGDAESVTSREHARELLSVAARTAPATTGDKPASRAKKRV